MNEIVVHPPYVDLYVFIQNLPQNFDKIGSIIQNNRNDIRICNVNGYRLVIKSFKGMYFPNKVAYSLFRKSKAQRSYEFSFFLQSKGIRTPKPVGYVDCYQYGFLTDSYFVSEYLEHTHFNTLINNVINQGSEAIRNAVHDLARFTFQLHLSNVYHVDYSNGNLLCNNSNGHYEFALVDLNRIKFRKIDFRKGLLNFATLNIPQEALTMLVSEYTSLCGLNYQQSLELIENYKKNASKRKKIRTKLKHSLLQPLQQAMRRLTVK